MQIPASNLTTASYQPIVRFITTNRRCQIWLWHQFHMPADFRGSFAPQIFDLLLEVVKGWLDGRSGWWKELLNVVFRRTSLILHAAVFHESTVIRIWIGALNGLELRCLKIPLQCISERCLYFTLYHSRRLSMCMTELTQFNEQESTLGPLYFPVP